MSIKTFPSVLPMRRRAEIINKALSDRLDTILPVAMREAGIDMWLVICQEDNLDPVFASMIPMDTWCPILQMLIFYDRGSGAGVERINLSQTNTKDLYDVPWKGKHHGEQWPLLRSIVEERDPKRIGIDVGKVQWAAGGLTHNLYNQLVEALPRKYVKRLVSAEECATRWLATLTDGEVALYEHIVSVAHALMAECYNRSSIVPGVTTAQDLEWRYWQLCADNGFEVAFKPSFYPIRRASSGQLYGGVDPILRAGDLVRCDVGIKYLGLITDHQEWVYILKPGETQAPTGLRALMAEGNRLQDTFMAEFKRGLTGDQLLNNILAKARRKGIPNPKVYSHSLGRLLHEPGPLIGLPWEQVRNIGRGEVRLEDNYAFTMELSVEGPVPEWGGESLRFALEEDVVFTASGCRLIDGRQTEFFLV
jgi:Xaa-Pro aminopeptidase